MVKHLEKAVESSFSLIFGLFDETVYLGSSVRCNYDLFFLVSPFYHKFRVKKVDPAGDNCRQGALL